MSLEAQVTELNVNIKALIAALGAGGVATAASTGTAAAASTTTSKPAATGKGKGAAAAKGPKREEVVALLTKIKDDHGTADAKAILAEVCGDGVKMADIPEESLKAVFDAANEFLTKAAAGTDTDDDGL